MADTQRSISDIITLAADNTTGAISAQDLRDIIKTLQPRYAAMYITSAAATTISVAGTYYKAAGTTTATNLHADFTMPASNRLQYNGAANIHAHVAVTADFTGGNAKVIGARVAIGGDATGTDAVASTTRHKTNTAGTDILSTALHFDTMMSTGNYLELWITNETDTTAVTIENMYFFIVTMPV